MIPEGSRNVVKTHPYYPAYFIVGKKGAGKSVLLERCLEIYYSQGYVVCDFNSAADIESLQWSVKDETKADGRAYPILVILPPTTIMTIKPRLITMPDGKQVQAVKTIPDSTPLKDIIMTAHREQRVIIFSIHLYESEVKGQLKFSQIIKNFPRTVRDHLPKTMKFAIGLRELADLSSNRMLTFAGAGERESKRGLNYFSRVARHFRCSIVLDMQDPDQIFSALTAQEDFILIKRLNKHHIPDKLRWLEYDINNQVIFARQHYLMSRLQVVSMDRLTNNSYYCVWPDGEFSLEHNREPLFKHHASDDDALELAGVELKFISKSELGEAAIENKIEKFQKRKEVEINRDKAIIEAIRMHEEEEFSWDECAVKVGWLLKDSKPSGQALKQAARRYKARQTRQGSDVQG